MKIKVVSRFHLAYLVKEFEVEYSIYEVDKKTKKILSYTYIVGLNEKKSFYGWFSRNIIENTCT